MRHLISLKEQTREDILKILDLAQRIKAKRTAGELTNYLPDKTLIMLFEKTSTRTRLSFEAGMTELGGHAIYLDARTTQLSICTDFLDEIRAIMRFGHVLMYRSLKYENVKIAAELNLIPVIDALSEKYHPCQALGDVMTMVEKVGGKIENLKGKKVVYLGVANNVSNSLVQVCTKLGVKITLCIAEKNIASYDEDLEVEAKKTGFYEETRDLSCVADADFVYTDSWIDMEFFGKNGEVIPEFREEFERRKKVFQPFQLSAALLDKYGSNAKIMHNMACHPPFEITRDAIEHPNSIIFDQAENRLHAQKAILVWLLEKENLVK